MDFLISICKIDSFIGFTLFEKSFEKEILSLTSKPPIIIAHRGAQAVYPEHTLEAYKKAIELGADFIEPDLVMTKDGILVSRHEPYLSATTDVEDHPEFADRKTTKSIDENEITDWFVSDFRLAELKTLRARQARPERSKEFDGLFEITTFQEIITLAKAHKTTTGTPIGIYPELKHPSYHTQLGLPMLETFLNQIEDQGFNAREAPIYVQCFEVATLKELRKRSQVRIVQLIGATGITEEGTLLFTKANNEYDSEGAPFDFRESGNTNTYEWFATREGMEFVATYADAIGPWKGFILPYKEDQLGNITLLPATNFVTLAHECNLEVHTYTLRDEDTQWQLGEDVMSEYRRFKALGVDGIFTDNTEEAVRALRPD